jgi:hypothetical protein
MLKYDLIIPSKSQLCIEHKAQLTITDVLYEKKRDLEDERDDEGDEGEQWRQR